MRTCAWPGVPTILLHTPDWFSSQSEQQGYRALRIESTPPSTPTNITMFDPSHPPLVSETLLKKRRSLDELALRRSTTVQVQNKRKRVVRGENVTVKRPEQFVKESRIRQGSLNKMNRRKNTVAQKTKSDNIPKQEYKQSVGFVVRIHEGRHSNEEIKKELKSMNLVKKYDAMFMKLDREGIARLKPLDAYVAYGYITEKSVIELVHRRAHIMEDGDKKALSDNMAVERALEDKNIICLNDLSHEIFAVGEHFIDAKDFLCTFSLASPTGFYQKSVLKVHDDVEAKGGFLGGNGMEQFLHKIL
jgi:large subunit ribosomal protein L7e